MEADASATPATSSQSVLGTLPEAYAGGQVARGAQLGVLGKRDMMDTPFSVTSYTAAVIENQQATTLSDALANDPSVRINIRGRGTFNGGGDAFYVRGFQLLNSDISLDGLFGVLPYGTVSMEMVERVEVIKGPNALLNGISPNGGVGGAINIVPKRAEDTPLTRLTTSWFANAQFGGHLHVGRRFGADKQFGVRINGVYRDGDTAVEGQRNRVGMVNVGLDYRSGDFRASSDIGYQNDRTIAPSRFVGLDTGVTMIPEAPRASNRTAEAWQYIHSKDVYASLRLEYDVLPEVTLFAAGGLRNHRHYTLKRDDYLEDDAGTLASAPTWYPESADSRTVQGGVRGTFRTGSLDHSFVIAGSYLRTKLGFAYASGDWGVGDLYRLIPMAAPSLSSLAGFLDIRRAAVRDFTSVVVADTISWHDRIQLTAGVRRQQVKADSFDPFTDGNPKYDSYDRVAYTPSVAILVRPSDRISLYANYIEALSQGTTAPANAENANQVFPPIKTRQKEVGVKLDLGHLGGTVAGFEIVQPNAISTPGSTSASYFYKVDGRQRNRGVELSVFGEVVPSLRVLGGITYLDAKQTRTEGGIYDGKDAIASPRWNSNLGLEWDTAFLDGLTLTGRMITTSAQYADAANMLRLPGWTRWDAGARYTARALAIPLTIRAVVQNLANRNYWEGTAGPTGLRLALPRTATLSVSFDF